MSLNQDVRSECTYRDTAERETILPTATLWKSRRPPSADDDKYRFEKRLGKIAKAKPKPQHEKG
jgi:hypothetical protein